MESEGSARFDSIITKRLALCSSGEDLSVALGVGVRLYFELSNSASAGGANSESLHSATLNSEPFAFCHIELGALCILPLELGALCILPSLLTSRV